METSGDVVSFGPFELRPSKRLLTRDGAPVAIGDRALDLLVALVTRANEVVGKKDILAEVWPGTFVEEGSLRFQIASLRKVLGDSAGGSRHVATVAGRGYCFVAPVSRSPNVSSEAGTVPDVNLPTRPNRIVGRSEDVRLVSAQLLAKRFVTIVGSGGVGKTTLATAVGHALVDDFAGAVIFADFGALSDPGLVDATVASLLGRSTQSDDYLVGLIGYLRDKRALLILDTCEHLIDAIATMAERIVAAAPRVHILATSREALRVQGEHVFKLGPLSCPPDDPALVAAEISLFPAAELFLERAAASGARFELSKQNAALVSRICRTLGGVPLALELAAGRVEAHGLQQTTALLDQHLELLWPGHRTAPPRQRTLQATMDWSYALLSESERTVLRRLAVFVGQVTFEAALEVVTSAAPDRADVFAAIDSLVAKSILAVRPVGAMVRYRLLDTTRAYALQIPLDDPEAEQLAMRHARYFRRWLEDTGRLWPGLSTAAERARHLTGLNNVRSALEWSFGSAGDLEIAVALAIAAAPVLLAMSLLPEAQRWSERGLTALNEASLGGVEEMRLQAALGVALMFTRGGSRAAGEALSRSFAIAETLGTPSDQLQLFGPLNMFHLRAGNFRKASDYARRCSLIIGELDEPADAALAYSISGVSLHLGGDLPEARAALEAALRQGERAQSITSVTLGFEGKILASAMLARNDWLEGRPRQAVARAKLTVAEAAAMDHPLTLAIALIWATTVFLWTGDFRSADASTQRTVDCADAHSLAPYLLVGQGFRGELAMRCGDARAGVATLQTCLEQLHATPYELLTTGFCVSLVQGFTAIGRFDDAAALADSTLRAIEANGDQCYLPELMRVKGKLRLVGAMIDADEAEQWFMRSLALSQQQGARGWTLRTAIDYAALLRSQRRREAARAVLGPVLAAFEPADTADLRAARREFRRLSG